ncbi:hypothetical protein PFISCL1PPCAC_27968, partial [Pristionchus fissidentatus]
SMPNSEFTIFVDLLEFKVDAKRYAAESAFMRAMIEGNFKETSDGFVNLKDVTREDWLDFFEYFEGREPISADTIDGILYIADRFCFEGVKKAVEALLSDPKKIRQIPGWKLLALKSIQMINRNPEIRTRYIREILITTLEKDGVNVGLSVQQGKIVPIRQSSVD